MANKLYEEDNITAIANAIRAKNGSSNTYTVSQMADAINNIPVGGDITNGVIVNYKAAESTISANTFVDLVEQLETDTQLSSEANSQQYTTATQIATDTLFVTYKNGSYLYGVVCSVSGRTVTIGTPTQLSTVANSYQYVSVAETRLTNDSLLVAHRNGDYLYGLICSVSGTTITIGTDTQLSTGSNSYQDASVVYAGPAGKASKFIIAHRSGSYLYGVACSISTTLTVGTDTQLSSGSVSYNNAYAAYIADQKVIVVHNSGTTFYGVVCELGAANSLAITVGTDTQLCSQTLSYEYCRARRVDTGKLLITHRYNSNLYGMVCTIDGTTITPGTDTLLSDGNYSSDNASIVYLTTNKVFISHRNGDYLYGIVCNVSNTTITVGSEMQLSNVVGSYDFAFAEISSSSILYQGTYKIFIVHANNNQLYGMVVDLLDEAKVVASGANQTRIKGLTKGSCSTTSAGNVWVLDV